ncbi:uncharacterized protein KGF55_002389 [Candida pseudojiufengensis]|uniref:uncharacterized protein n=1 Tax=Candida pseudojiufengensis TaxID=497109 RepID=UPI0022256DB1|nr:uncharacterized protein KGF55_002389 [Candida pseudojiufengensis]KAI5963509.1 hypothetical protein KGF55_002389 [Candida pseudojiufengensis]
MVASSSQSTSTVVSTLVANLLLFATFISCFLILRLKFKRIYSPKSSFNLVPEDQKPEPLPKDPIRWIFILLSKPQSFILQQAGLDGYFYLRYLKIFAFLFLFGLLIWIILLPINATNGKGLTGFDQLSIANVDYHGRYYAHVFIGWVWYGAIMFVIYRELFFYNSLKNVVLSSPKYAKKLSSRTVLFQGVPDVLLDEKQIYKIFNGVKRIYVARTSRTLEHKVNKRAAIVNKLEIAENKILKLAVKNKMKADKKGKKLEPIDEISAYVPEKKRPRTRTGGIFSKKTDTIRYCQEQIPILNEEVKQLQRKFRHQIPSNSLFVEFENQYYAQMAYQTTIHHNPMRMSPAYIGIEPADINWINLRMFWWERITRRSLAFSAIVALILFWAIPVAFVGVISNFTYLTNKLPWLRWIERMPSQILGIVTGILPTAMLSILMLLLPMFIRAMAKIAGAISYQSVEIYTQNAYFGFLMVNGFLVTALASSATATVTQIVAEPTSAMTILAEKLPLSSNFYISYLVLQGLAIAGGSLFQVVGLFLYYILGYLLDNTVRKKWNRFSGLGTMAYGTTFPIATQLACITLAYSVISPLIIAFACIGFFLLYITYCHNLLYVFAECPDTRGQHFPIALFQTFTGIYIGQVCMLGIFAVGKGWGPIVLQVIGLVATVFIHVHLAQAFDHLLKVVPLDCMRALDGISNTPSYNGPSEFQYKILDKKRHHHDPKYEAKYQQEQINEEKIKEDLEKEVTQQDHEADFGTDLSKISVVPLLADRDHKLTNSKNPIVRFLRPDVFYNYRHVKSLLPATFNIEPPIEDDKHAYDAPAISAKCPGVWIPKDPMNLASIEIEKLSPVVNISDENAGFNEKGKIVFFGKPPN